VRLLILGGTRFLGRHLTDAALARGHELTLFTRGQSGPDLYPHLEHLRGNRDPNVDPGLTALDGHRWDAVIDTSGYVPRVVGAGVERLRDQATHYTFISSISAYRDFEQVGIDESYPTGTLEDQSVEQITGDTYGPLKALCERAVQEAFPGRALIVRPGLIVGPHDPTDRFTYWPVRVARGGEVLAPNGPRLPTQIIDARDLAEWTIQQVERFADGVFNATGPAQPLTLGEVLETARTVSRRRAACARFVRGADGGWRSGRSGDRGRARRDLAALSAARRTNQSLPNASRAFASSNERNAYVVAIRSPMNCSAQRPSSIA
jgi:2'-hydroxyisoflavone reductase